jgi:uncharacterized protein (DUF2235 family)
MPKNIAIFADGTGNSAAKFNKTNVWRLYRALETNTSQARLQLGYYHDGVGTSSFRPLALLGGAFGWGLKRNLLDMYNFICRNYVQGDQIFLFGFSRGSFTVRILTGFIAVEGLVAYTGDADLGYHARDAYRSYRRRFDQTRGLVDPLRNLRDGIIRILRRLTKRPAYAQIRQHNHRPRVAFVGVFDTVAAYGMPIAELTRGIDRYVWPLSMPNYELSDKVDAACHALSLDDERDTFHPLLWDEISSHHPDRIKQVWFAGVHSDVGGGYPDDTASYIPLAWMLREAAGAGLRFAPTAVEKICRIAGYIGPLHDSRRGLAGYYRYQPRKIGAYLHSSDPTTLIMQDPTLRKRGGRPRLRLANIHQSVIDRIATGNDSYAPLVLPKEYNTIAAPAEPASPRETLAGASLRAQEQERGWDWVWHKRVNYFLSVGVSVYLALLPGLNAYYSTPPCAGPQCLLAPAISTIGEFVPGFAAPWINAFAATPGRTAIAILALTLLLIRSGVLSDRIRTDMRALWEQSLSLPPVSRPPRPSAAWVRRLRSSRRYQVTLQTLKWRLAPNGFGVLLLLGIVAALVVLPGSVALRWSIWSHEYADQCPSQTTAFATSITCTRLPIHVAAQGRYRVTIEVGEPWADASISTSPKGYGPTRMSFIGNLAAPMRRSPTARWFQPLVKIVGDGETARQFRIVPLEMHLVDPAHGVYAAEFVAPIDGDSYFFVNDVLLPKWTEPLFKLLSGGTKPDALSNNFYKNNQGAAAVSIKPCPTEAASPCPFSSP